MILVGGLGYATADVYDVVPGPLTARPVATPPPPPPPAPGATVPAPARPVLEAVDPDAALPSPPVVAAAVTPLLSDPALGPSVSATVVDALTGRVLFDQAGDEPREPASTSKLLTAAATLTTLDPASTLDTMVVDGPSPQEVVLVGRGDVLLAAGTGDADLVNGRAGLGDLAALTAQALLGQGRDTVAVRLDDTAFVGAGTAASWSPSDVDGGFVAPVTAIAVDAGRAAQGKYAARHDDPSMVAATTFSAALEDEGVTVVGEPARVAAAAQAQVLATVSSAPVAELTAYMLVESDNTLAEALARLVAGATGRRTTFEDAAVAVVDAVARLGVDTIGTRLADGSGLGEGSVVSASTLTELLVLAASPEHPELRTLLTGLPVAGFSGTLLDRFDDPSPNPAGGLVRAKTGSLNGVTTLAGAVTDVDGRLLLFAVMADQVPAAGTIGAREAVDRVAGALAACGCR